MIEEWKDIKGYEGLYQVSNLGRVKSIQRTVKNGRGYRLVRERILNNNLEPSGYMNVRIGYDSSYKTWKVHQLVAQAFLNHKPDGHSIVVDHIDNDKTNNKLSNLQLISQRENCSKDKKGTSNYTGVCFHKATGKWMAQIVLNGEHIHLGIHNCEFAAYLAYKNKLNEVYEHYT